MMVVSAIAQSAPTAYPQPRLVKAAHEFEAQLMKELLKPMTRTTGMEEDADSASGGVLADFATEALGQALSLHGGLGIANSIIRNLSRNNTSSQAIPGPATPEPKVSVSASVDSSKFRLCR